jgi:phage-related protein
MKGVTFGTYHSYDDFSLILTSKEIAAPKTKTMKIDVEGADGSIDLTDFFGEPKYEDCTHKFQFSTIVPQSEFLTLFSTIKNTIHGKKLRIVLDDDPGFFYIGRCYVSSFTNEKNIGKISVECDCEPWKYKAAKTVVTQAVSGESTISLPNLRKRVVPEVVIEADSAMHIVYNTYNVWDLGGGSYTLPELELKAGENSVSVTGTGNITFSYQEAAL